jgi:hypothetical protein
MAKKSMSTKFLGACISKEGDSYIITETKKDTTTVYNLTEVLDSFLGIEGISLTIATDSELKPLED